jgi:hypothetical protein
MRHRVETPKTRFDVVKAYLELQKIRRVLEREEATVHPTRALHSKREKDGGSNSQQLKHSHRIPV